MTAHGPENKEVVYAVILVRAALCLISQEFTTSLGLACPTTLVGKPLYREIGDSKTSWNTSLPEQLLKRWKAWKNTVTENLTVPRAVTTHRHPVTYLTLLAISDASARGVSAAVYAVVVQDQGITQQLLIVKSCPAEKNLTIPRLELVKIQEHL